MNPVRHCKDCKHKDVLIVNEPCKTCATFSNFEPKDTPSKKTDYTAYCRSDIERVQNLYKQAVNSFYGILRKRAPEIENVIFNDPATIVFWKDGTKTVVKTQNGDPYDPEKGLAMAISKRVFGNDYAYYNVFKKWLKKAPKNGTLDYCSDNRVIIGKVCSVDSDSDGVYARISLNGSAEADELIRSMLFGNDVPVSMEIRDSDT